MRVSRAVAAGVTAVLTLTLSQLLIGAPASQAAIAQPSIVNSNPADFTPYVLDGSVKAIVQSGSKIIVGGTFTQVREVGTGKPTLTRNNLFAFNATTGVVDTAFVPNVNGLVASLVVSADNQSVYVGGAFTTIGGVGPRSVARLNLSNGARTAGFSPPTYNSQIKDLKLVGNVLYTVGAFSYIGSTVRNALATLNATTGALTTVSTVAVTGAHNGGVTQILKIDVSPAGDRLVAIGNFTQINGVNRNQFAMFSITPTSTTLGWYTPFYEGGCASVFESYMRDLDFSPDGSYFVVSTTGAYGGPDSPCDLTARYETYTSSGDTVMPTWRDYTGGDTTYAVAVTGTAVYVGGHQRWQNNPYAGDRVGPGAVPRPGIAALDPVNGLPFSWNPTRDLGVGVFDFLVTPTGLWEGSDTLNVGGEYHPRLAFFPIAGGTSVPSNATGALSNDVYLTGRTVNAPKPSVLYRINTGGPTIASADDGPAWQGDDQWDNPYRNSGTNTAGWSPVPSVDATVPNVDTDRAPRALFDSERWSPGNPEMSWSFPVPAGEQIQVRLYFANRYGGTSGVGGRVFNVDLNGNRVLNNYDIVADVGHDVGTMKSWNLTSTGTVNIDFGHVVENPLINGIEIVRTDLPPNPVSSAKDDVQRRYFTGAFVDPSVTLPNTGPAWGSARGSMLIDGTVYYASSDGSFYAASFDGTTFGTPTAVNLYGGYFGGEASSVTGMFFSNGRMYYTLAGDNTLHYRYFTPQSRVVGAIRYDAAGDMGAFGGARVSGMFLSGGKVYLADSASGNLLSMDFANNALSGSVAVADASQDWRTRGMFVWNGTPKPRVGVPPIASGSVSCTFLACSFNGTGSSDPDGSVVAYAWNFADSGTSALSTVNHTFAAAGTYNVTLTVTDDAGQTGMVTMPVTVDLPPNQLPTAAAAVSCTYLVCAVNAAGSSDPDGTITGYTWNFGDTGSSTSASDSHTFGAGGTYDVVLTVTDNRGGTDAKTTTVTVAPNTSPTAAVSVTCTDLVCANSSAGSSDAEGPITYEWDFGDGNHSTAVSPSHTYGGSGTFTVGLTVTDGGGLTATASQQVTVTAPTNIDPVARATVSCTYLVCSYDGGTSTDSDGSITSYAWDFGNTASSTAVSGSYTYPVGGGYSVKLTVTDNNGGTNTVSVPVAVAPVTSPIAFVGSRDLQANAATAAIQSPAGTQVGNAMLLFITTNTTAAVTSLTGSWALVGERLAGDATPDLRTRLYSKVATAADVGGTSTLTLASASKAELTMLVYSGTDAAAPVAAWVSSKETVTTATHLGPNVAVADPRSWAVSYWADKTNASTGWATPAGSALRAGTTGTGSGRIAGLAVDNAGPVGVGSTFTGLSAVSSVASYKATMWTILLKPSP